MGFWKTLKDFLFDDQSIKNQFQALIEADEAAKPTAAAPVVNDQITDAVTAPKPKRGRKPKAAKTK